MLLALDVGNTNTVLGLYRLDAEPPALAAHWRVTTHRSQTVDEYGVFFVNLFEMHGMAPNQVSHIIISSVVPPVDSTLRQMCETYFHVQPLFVEPGIKTGVPVLQDNPADLGADRLVNVIAAFERYGGPCVVVDFGTATTFDVMSAKGEYMGGAIAPGLGLSAEALFSRAARLSRVEIKRPAKGDRHQHRDPSAERTLLRLHRPRRWNSGAHCCRAGHAAACGGHRRPGAADFGRTRASSPRSTTCSRSTGC